MHDLPKSTLLLISRFLSTPIIVVFSAVDSPTWWSWWEPSYWWRRSWVWRRAGPGTSSSWDFCEPAHRWRSLLQTGHLRNNSHTSERDGRNTCCFFPQINISRPALTCHDEAPHIHTQQWSCIKCERSRRVSGPAWLFLVTWVWVLKFLLQPGEGRPQGFWVL